MGDVCFLYTQDRWFIERLSTVSVREADTNIAELLIEQVEGKAGCR